MPAAKVYALWEHQNAYTDSLGTLQAARVTGGVGARFDGGVMLTLGGELGGIGSNTQIWTVTGRARVPFSAR